MEAYRLSCVEWARESPTACYVFLLELEALYQRYRGGENFHHSLLSESVADIFERRIRREVAG